MARLRPRHRVVTAAVVVAASAMAAVAAAAAVFVAMKVADFATVDVAGVAVSKAAAAVASADGRIAGTVVIVVPQADRAQGQGRTPAFSMRSTWSLCACAI